MPDVDTEGPPYMHRVSKGFYFGGGDPKTLLGGLKLHIREHAVMVMSGVGGAVIYPSDETAKCLGSWWGRLWMRVTGKENWHVQLNFRNGSVMSTSFATRRVARRWALDKISEVSDVDIGRDDHIISDARGTDGSTYDNGGTRD